MRLRRDQWTLLGASLASVALWATPLLRPFALPLIYLNTHIHELCHAVTTIATGGAVENIIVLGDGSGSFHADDFLTDDAESQTSAPLKNFLRCIPRSVCLDFRGQLQLCGAVCFVVCGV